MVLPDGVDDILPLTAAQTGMLFHVLEAPSVTGRYVAVVSATITGTLDPARLRQAFNDAVASRDAYRAAFVWERVKQPVQTLMAQIDVPWRDLDWREHADVNTRFDALLDLEQSRQFNLKRAPLMAVTLVRLKEDQWQLVWTIHHLISDGWSTSVVLRDILKRYDAPNTHVPSPTSFKSYLLWLRKNTKLDSDYWRGHLDGIPGSCLFPHVTDGPAQPHLHLKRELGTELHLATHALAAQLRVTKHTVLSATWALVLRHILQEDDVIFGHTTAGRPAQIPGISKAAGAFLNTLPLRVQIDPNQSVSDMIRSHGREILARGPHEFAALSEVNACAPIPKGATLFDTLFVNEGTAQTDIHGAEFQITRLETRQSSNYAVAMLVHPETELEVELYCDPARCPLNLAERLLDCYKKTLRAVLARPEHPVCDVIWHDFDPISVPEPDPLPSVLKRILDVAERTPNALAISDSVGSVTYATLVQNAMHVAKCLRSSGIKCGDIIPVATTRGIDAVVDFLGVMMCGAAYVPIDTNYPAGRIADVLAAVNPDIVLTDHQSRTLLPPTNATLLVPGDMASDPEPGTISEGDLAYVMFTSGSQGRPKGVMISHSALAISTAQREQVYSAQPSAYLLLSSLAFDSSVAGIYWTLTTGCHLIIAPHRVEQSPRDLGRLIRENQVTHTLCLPSLAQSVVTTVPAEDLQTLRLVIAAGEAMFPDLIADLTAALPDCQIVNEYGPTEGTVWCTWFDATEGTLLETIPIGHALPAAWVGVVDADGYPCPAGTIGEIAIAGPMLAEGYLNNPSETQRRFTRLGPGGPRAYKTGDLGRLDADGLLYFVGRTDTQVKVRGHRVELAEIEQTAKRVDKGIEVTAIATPHGADTSITLFVETAPHRNPIQNIRTHIQAHLPTPFHPARYIDLTSFPRLPNGKVNKNALNDIAIAPQITDSFVAGETALERKVAGLFASALGRSDFSRDANFFEEGGDSLMTIAVYSAGKDAGLVFEPSDVFSYPTPARLSQHIQNQTGKHYRHKTQGVMLTTHESGTQTPVFFVHASTFLLQQVARGLGQHHPVGLLVSNHMPQTPAPYGQTISDMARDAIARLRDLRPEGPYVLCGYSIGCAILLEMCAQLDASDVSELFIMDPPFDLIGIEPRRQPFLQRTVFRWHTLARSQIRLARYAFRIPSARKQAQRDPENEALRITNVNLAYRAATTRYRLKHIDHKAKIYLTPGNPAMQKDGALDTHLSNKEVQHFDMTHEDLVSAPDAVVLIAADIIRAAKAP